MNKKRVSKQKQKTFSEKITKNHWIAATITLAILLIISSAINLSSGTTVSKEKAGQNVLGFAIKQGADAKLVNVVDDGSLYQVTLSISGQEVPVYVTKDGKSLIPQQIPLTEEKTSTPTATESTTEVPKSDKPVVEAFVMAYCPYGTQIEKGILPVVKALGDKIDFQVKFVYYSMHPTQGEVQENLKQYCIETEQNGKYLDYLTCFLDAGDEEGCMNSTGIDRTALATCTEKTDKEFNVMANLNDKSSWLNGRYPKFDIDKADNEKYGVKGSPTLVINGVTTQSGRDSISLLNTICGAFNTAPEECNTKFEAVSPTPGFGWSTTENTNNAAACGA